MESNPLAAMSPTQRSEFIKRRREEAAAKQREEEIERLRKSKDRADQRRAARLAEPQARKQRVGDKAARQKEADDLLAAQCKNEAIFPVRLGNLLGPEGNVFNVIGAVRSGIRWAEAHGVLLPDEAYEIVNGYRQRKYDETIAMIEAYGWDLDESIDAYYESFDGMSGADSIRFGDNPLGGLLGKGGATVRK